MRSLSLVLLAAAAQTLSGVAWAQSPPTALVAGVANPSVAYTAGSWCAVEGGATSFQRLGGGPANISFEGLTYVLKASPQNQATYLLKGQAVLKFATSTSGKAVFSYPSSYPATVRAPEFSGYSQSYDSAQKTLGVKFSIKLNGDCVIPFAAVYRN